MSQVQASRPKPVGRSRRTLIGAIAVAIVVLAAIAYSTKVVQLGSAQDASAQEFSPDRFGEQQFPKIQDEVVKRAVDAPTLATAVLADKAAASKQYGVGSTTGVLMSVKLTGVVGEGKSGIYEIRVEGVPPEVRIRAQTGPAINGTDLRDATGDIKFEQFKNQIEYQDAGSGINRAMKKAVLSPIDPAGLSGKTISLVGVFRLINPKNWLITPVQATVK